MGIGFEAWVFRWDKFPSSVFSITARTLFGERMRGKEAALGAKERKGTLFSALLAAMLLITLFPVLGTAIVDGGGVAPSSVPGAPSPPTNLTISLSPGEALFNWSLPASDGGSPITNIVLTIEAGDPVNMTYQSTLFVDSSYTKYSFDFKGGWNYSAYVIAINANGWSDPSIRANFTALFAPAYISDVWMTSGDGFINLTWLPPDDGGSPILQYNISRETTGQFGSGNFIVPGGQTYFNDTGVTNGVQYYYEIHPVNALGSFWGSNLYFATPGVPSPPLDLRLVTIGSGSVTFEWSPPASDSGSPITMYRIFTGGFGDQLVTETSPTITLYSNSSLNLGVRYFFTLRAVNQYGESEWSNWIDVQMPPSSPKNLTALAGKGFVNLTWKAPSSNQPWEIWEYNIVRQGGNEVVSTYIGTSYNEYFNDTNEGGHNGPTTGVSYQYYVTAEIYYVESDASNVVSVTAGTVPGAPSGLIALVDSRTIRLNWTAPADDGGCDMVTYLIYRGESSGILTYLANVTGDVTRFNDTTVVEGKTAYYQVAAVNAIGSGAHSSTVNATVEKAPSGGTDMTIIILILALVVGVALAALVLVRSKRKP